MPTTAAICGDFRLKLARNPNKTTLWLLPHLVTCGASAPPFLNLTRALEMKSELSTILLAFDKCSKLELQTVTYDGEKIIFLTSAATAAGCSPTEKQHREVEDWLNANAERHPPRSKAPR
jgi:hypothetical protein